MEKIKFLLIALIAMAFGSCIVEEPNIKEDTINSKVVMRSCNVNGNEWAILPEYPDSSEILYVLTVIGTKTAEECDFPDECMEYVIQHVGGAHHMYSYVDKNGALHNNIDGTTSQEFLEIMENDSSWVHVLNFNAGKCDNAATHNASLMTNGFKDARTLSEYSSSSIKSWKIFFINNQYYLGFDYSQKKEDGEIVGDGIYDDWVVKIIPVDIKDTTKEESDTTYHSKGHVEFDVHQQEHSTWKEIKTSIHLRDTVDFTILLPIPGEYQAKPDDFDIRIGNRYEYLAHEIVLVDKKYDIEFIVTHKQEGIEIFIGGSKCSEALKVARTLYDDGLTFEVHSYVVNDSIDDNSVWEYLKSTELPIVNPNTILVGQITSAFYPNDSIKINNQ